MGKWIVVICAALGLVGCKIGVKNSGGQDTGGGSTSFQGTWKTISATCNGAPDTEYTNAIQAGAADILVFDGSGMTETLEDSSCSQTFPYSIAIDTAAATLSVTADGSISWTCTPSNCAVSEFTDAGTSLNCTSTGGGSTTTTTSYAFPDADTLELTITGTDCNSTTGTETLTYQKQ